MAKKTLRERLFETNALSEAQESAQRFAMFLKYWEEISAAYREGWSYKEIWRVLHRDGLIDFSYSSFLNFTRKLKRRQEEFQTEAVRKVGNAAAAAAISAGTGPRSGHGKSEPLRFGQEGTPKRF